MNVKELIEELSKYPMDMEIAQINSVYESVSGQVVLTHRDTLQDVEKRKRRAEEWDKQHSERMESSGEITSFSNRW